MKNQARRCLVRPVRWSKQARLTALRRFMVDLSTFRCSPLKESLFMRRGGILFTFLKTSFKMYASLITLLATSAAVGAHHHSESASITPHDKYSSSIGVPGCLINTDRVAYRLGQLRRHLRQGHQRRP